MVCRAMGEKGCTTLLVVIDRKRANDADLFMVDIC